MFHYDNSQFEKYTQVSFFIGNTVAFYKLEGIYAE